MKFEIFGGEGCPYCVKAKELLNDKNLPFSYFDINQDEEAFDQLVGRISKWKTIPQIFFGSQHIGGYDDLLKFLISFRMINEDTYIFKPDAFEINSTSKRETDLIEANNRYLMRAREAEYLLKEVLPLLEVNKNMHDKVVEHMRKHYID